MKIEEIWNEQEIRDVEIEVSASRRKKSTNLVHKITSRLKLERSTTYFVGPVLFIFTLYHEAYLLGLLVGVYLLGLILYYNYLIGRIQSVSLEDSVLQFLRHTLSSLKRFRTHYVILGLVSFAVGFGMTSEIYQFDLTALYDPVWITVILLGMVATPLVTFYLHFHPHLKKIRKIVHELEQKAE